MYDVFVSYCTPDLDWAERLQKSLIDRGLNVFFDRTRLEPGDAWVSSLRQALAQSKHLVAVWSKLANQSPWVQRELATFDAHVSTDATRKLMLLNLEEPNRAYASIQGIEELRNANVYAAGAKTVDAALWNSVIDRIERVINSDDESVPIPLVLLTLRQQDFEHLDPTLVQRIADGLGLKRDDLLSSYGPTRLDWKPLGSTRTIGEMLEGLREFLNKKAAGNRFRWDREPAAFWEAPITDETKQFAREFLAAGLSVIVIDAIALLDIQVFQRLMSFQDCLTNQRTAIFVLPPWPGDPRLFRIRDWLKNSGHPYFAPYFDPMAHPNMRVLAQCGFSIADEEEMQRLLQVNVGQFLIGRGAAGKPEYLNVGSAGP